VSSPAFTNHTRPLAGYVRRSWAWLRRLTGDDAYERYRVHQLSRHPGGHVMERAAFYAEEQRRKWSGISRCC
jgi:uncharacterized short protein YbdD (DUF466 family)